MNTKRANIIMWSVAALIILIIAGSLVFYKISNVKDNVKPTNITNISIEKVMNASEYNKTLQKDQTTIEKITDLIKRNKTPIDKISQEDNKTKETELSETEKSATVKYDLEIPKKFENAEWVSVSIVLNNMNETDIFLSEIPETEFKLIRKSRRWIIGEITQKRFERLKRDKRINIIYFNSPVFGSLIDSVPLVDVRPEVWNLGFSGSGIKVCVIDSGVNKTHSDLNGKIVAEHCYCSISDPLLGTSNCCPDGTAEDTSAKDYNGHGTHVTGIIASQNSTYKGVAYNASIYHVKVLNSNNAGNMPDIGDAIDWCVTQNVGVISISIGDSQNHPGVSACPTTIDSQINDSYALGIPVIIASGNNGYTNGISYPACSPNAISVGATYDENLGREPDLPNSYCLDSQCTKTCSDGTTSNKTVACFTNRYNTLDLMAPGCFVSSINQKVICGSSASAAYVAGSIALIIGHAKALGVDLSPDEVKQILLESSTPSHSLSSNRIIKQINIQNALRYLENKSNEDKDVIYE